MRNFARHDMKRIARLCAGAVGFAFCGVTALEASAAMRVSLDEGWLFKRDGQDSRIVDVPHDWSIESAPQPNAPTAAGGGFYAAGKATYERSFTLSEAEAEAGVSLVFDGIYRDAKVFVNGEEAGRGTFYGYTGFRVPLAGRVHAGENAVRVEVDNSAQPNCRWYSGSGIVRHVRLEGADEDTCAASLPPPVRHDIKWSAEDGLVIDGVPTLLHGACVHHDHGPLGAASHDGAELRKVRQLKAAGFNAVRTSHNPASDAFLAACDSEGLWVIQELCDGWRKPKTAHDYSEAFERDWERDLRWMIETSKHHPSIIAWSIGNEILERTDPWAAEQAALMVAVCHECDPSRPVLEALCSWNGEKEWLAQDPMAANLDIVGYNYMEHMTESDHERVPNRVIIYTETYPADASNTWRRIVKHPYVLGEFVWTGIDYLGESSIGRTYYKGAEPPGEHYAMADKCFPWHGAYCGDIDLTGWRKPISHLRETLWNPRAPTYMAVREPNGWRGEIATTKWSVWPMHESWDFRGWENKGVIVEVYTRQPKVALFLNERLIGERDVSEASAFTASFEVPYEPGELKAVAGDESFVLRTPGEPKSIRFSSELFGNLEYVVAEVVDAQGTVCRDADWSVTFEGDVIATCSADLRDTTPATSRTRRVWQGRALAIRRRANNALPNESDHQRGTP